MTHPTTVVPIRQPPAIDGAGLTHVGMVRERNEDSILTDPSGVLWAVADGMGGHGHGDVASDLVTGALAAVPTDGDPRRVLVAGIEAANAEVHRRAEVLGPMGATVVALMIEGRTAHVAWAGDSRAYLLRGGSIAPLTRDHSVVQELIDRGALAPGAAAEHPDAHVVTRAVGAGPGIEVDLVAVPLADGDRIVLCSDGLSGCLPAERIAALLGVAPTAEAACRALVAGALEAGAPDNVSVVVVLVGEA